MNRTSEAALRLCARCRLERPRDAFRPNPRVRDGLSSWCRECAVERTREWRAANRDALNARRRAAYQPAARTHVITCRTCGATVEVPLLRKVYCSRRCHLRWRHSHEPRVNHWKRRRVLERDGWRCYLCLGPIDPEVRWPRLMSATVDHVIPVREGGTHAPENLRAAHWACNRDKGATALRRRPTP